MSKKNDLLKGFDFSSEIATKNNTKSNTRKNTKSVTKQNTKSNTKNNTKSNTKNNTKSNTKNNTKRITNDDIINTELLTIVRKLDDIQPHSMRISRKIIKDCKKVAKNKNLKLFEFINITLLKELK
jgi:hypothetical protein